MNASNVAESFETRSVFSFQYTAPSTYPVQSSSPQSSSSSSLRRLSSPEQPVQHVERLNHLKTAFEEPLDSSSINTSDNTYSHELPIEVKSKQVSSDYIASMYKHTNEVL